jgi:hypothetical protein
MLPNPLLVLLVGMGKQIIKTKEITVRLKQNNILHEIY